MTSSSYIAHFIILSYYISFPKHYNRIRSPYNVSYVI